MTATRLVHPTRVGPYDVVTFMDSTQNGIWAKVIADSRTIDEDGVLGTRLTTLECRIPKTYLAEWNTHDRLNSNTASSRAITSHVMIEAVKTDPYKPTELGMEQKGMSPGDLISAAAYEEAMQEDDALRAKAIETAERWMMLGVHKSKVNRKIEPWVWSTIVVTATEWENFLNLRMDSYADIEMQRIATCIRWCLDASKPALLERGEWHLPYVTPEEAERIKAEGFDPVAISVARCGRVSTLNHGKVRAYELDEKWHNDGMAMAHWSPFQHQAQHLVTTNFSTGAKSGLEGNLEGDWVMYRKTQPGEAVFRG